MHRSVDTRLLINDAAATLLLVGRESGSIRLPGDLNVIIQVEGMAQFGQVAYESFRRWLTNMEDLDRIIGSSDMMPPGTDVQPMGLELHDLQDYQTG